MEFNASVLLIGPNGFLGSHLVDYLKDKVKILYLGVRTEEQIKPSFKNIHYYTTNGLIKKNVADLDIDIVINAAVAYGRMQSDPKNVSETNVVMPLKLIHAVKNPNCVFINFDSFYTKFPTYLNSELYIKSKLDFVKSAKKTYGKKIVVLRLEHLYGQNDANHKFIPMVIDHLSKNKKELALTAGEQKRDFIDVSDLVNLIGQLLKNKSIIKLGLNHFDVGTGISTSLKEFLIELKSQLNSTTVLKFGEIPYGENEIMESKANIEDLYLKFKWKPSVSLKNGISQLILNESQST